MRLSPSWHLAYCTNIHRGETWAETFAALKTHALAVRDRVCAGRPFAIGLRLSQRAAVELSHRAALLEFQRWLEAENTYVFTINGFPYGQFHGTRVKENVYAPDWTRPDRLAYTNLLFDLLAELTPPGVAGSVSTLPGSFKAFITQPTLQRKQIATNLWSCVEHIERLEQRTGKTFHLGLEPEPLGMFENSDETIAFFEEFAALRAGDERWRTRLGVNYDACHFAIEYEDPAPALARLRAAGLLVSKLHLSSALRLRPSPEALDRLNAFVEPTYLHQVIVRDEQGQITRFTDLPDALSAAASNPTLTQPGTEWRVHFHVPLHWKGDALFQNTTDHLEGVFTLLRQDPALCSHLEIETYTWEVMPGELRTRSVVSQIADEYDWCLQRLSRPSIG
jgi:hypothetical protein